MLRQSCRLRICLLAVLALAHAAGAFVVHADESYKMVFFWTLQSFNYNSNEKWVPTPTKVANPPIPTEVKSLDGQRIAIFGTTMPLNYKSGAVTEFILAVSEDACEFGATPRINEWIAVKMVAGKKAMVQASGEAWVRGVFHIKEMVENGKVVQLYSIDADSVQ